MPMTDSGGMQPDGQLPEGWNPDANRSESANPANENSGKKFIHPKRIGQLRIALVGVLWLSLSYDVTPVCAVCGTYFVAAGLSFLNGEQAPDATNSNYNYYQYCKTFSTTAGEYVNLTAIQWTTITQSAQFKQSWLCTYNGRSDQYFPLNCSWQSNITAFWETPAVPSCTLAATPSTINLGDSSTLTASCNPAATSYAWTNSGFGSSVASGNVSPTATTTYAVTGTNASGPGSEVNATVTVNALTEVTPSTRVNATPLALNRATGRFNGSITVTNTGLTPISGPLYVFFTLPAGVTLPSNSVYNSLPYTVIQGGLAPYATSGSVPVSFTDPTNVRIAYTTKVYTGQ